MSEVIATMALPWAVHSGEALMKAIGSKVLEHPSRDEERNRRTAHVAFAASSAMDFGTLFVGAYASFAPACRAVSEPGVAMVAVDERTHRLAGLSLLLAQPGRHVAAIVGRHDRCDLFLDASDDLPLRQLAMILDPVTSWRRGRSEMGYRLLDLRSAHGFRDEHGRALRGLRSDGAAVLRCPGYALFVLPLGDPTDWPEDGGDAWAFQPERVYFDEVSHLARGSSARISSSQSRIGRTTRITAIPGPQEAGVSLVADRDLAGTLELIGSSRRELIPVGHAALRDGVLLGRYSRCDSATIDDESVSRVHALLIQLGEALLVIDTASTYGTHAAGQAPARVHHLEAEPELLLGLETRARWRSQRSQLCSGEPVRA